MKDFFSSLITGYNDIFGTSKIMPLFFLAIAAVILLYNDSDEIKRRRIHPAVFLLSVYAGISYVVVLCFRKSKSLAVIIFSAVIVCMAGSFAFSEKTLTYSIYKNGESFEILFSVIALIYVFLIYALISFKLFEGGLKEIISDRIIFMGFVVLLSLFGYYSERLKFMTLLLSPLSAPSVIVHGVMPLLLWLYLVYEDKILKLVHKDEEETGDTEEFEEEWDMKKHKILNMRNMAIAFAVLLVGFITAVLVLNSKINTLYDATVLLNDAANEKASIYEIKSGDDISASVIVSSDGKVTVIGGGDTNAGGALLEKLDSIGPVVSKWYLYGEDDENKGAYDFCRDKGITVVSTYVLSGVKQIN